MQANSSTVPLPRMKSLCERQGRGIVNAIIDALSRLGAAIRHHWLLGGDPCSIATLPDGHAAGSQHHSRCDVLLTTVYVATPLEFSIFPSLLLATTLARLVLNVATTRLILTGADSFGMGAAGGVIKSFGEFVAGDRSKWD